MLTTLGSAARPSPPRVVAVILFASLLGAAGCTNALLEQEVAAPPGGPAASATPTTSTSPAAPISKVAVAPVRIAIAKVKGRLPRAERRVVVEGMREPVEAYLRGAFLGGGYPRTDFEDAFDPFTRRARNQARRHITLLTNAGLGEATKTVTAQKVSVLLDVLAPRGKAAGATARVDLVFVAERNGAAARRVAVSGRLLLSPSRPGGWKIFGYDLARSGTRVHSKERGS